MGEFFMMGKGISWGRGTEFKMNLILYLFFSPTDRKVEITKHLQDVEIEEESCAVFTCELSEDNEEVEWFLNDTHLYPNNFNEIKSVGKCHSLTLKHVMPEDAGTVTVKVQKRFSETARLKVKGESSLLRTTKMLFRFVGGS